MKKNTTVSPAPEQAQKYGKANEKSSSFLKLFAYADRVDIFLMVLGSICSIANGLSQPLMALLFGGLVDTFSTTNSLNMVHEISKLSFKLLYLAIGVGIAAFLQVLCWTITGERQASRLQMLYFRSLLRQEIGFFDTEMTVGQVIGTTSCDAMTIQTAISQKMGKSIQYMSTFLGGFLIAFTKGWLLSLVLVSMIPSLVIVGVIMAGMLTKMSIRQQAASSQAGDVVEETVGAIRTVSSLTAEKEAIVSYTKKLESAYSLAERQGLVSGLGLGTLTFIVFSYFGLAIWYGSKLILEKGHNGGEIACILVALVYGGVALGQFSTCINAIALGQAAAKKVLETIQREPGIATDDSTGIVLQNIKGEVELKDVHFRYPARPNVEVFSGLSLHIPGGKTVALVGKSGSGKSTVISLLERFYDPDGGEVLIDGVNVKKLQLRWLRKKIGLVSQEPVLFAASIRENVAYGKENATEDEIRKALELSSAASFIDNLPQGLETNVGNLGAQLSGGQKQRIAIARVILKNPRIFLLDEVTSALDTKTEKATYDAIFKLASERTTIIVTHNLSSIENVDSIAVMHQGKVVEQGTHDELIRDSDGHYSRFVFSQGKVEVENLKGMQGEMSNNAVSQEDKFESLSSSNRYSASCGDLCVKRSSSFADRVTCEENEMRKELSFEKNEKISIGRLVKLSKPELPLLLVGSYSAMVHGVSFPVFGLLFATSLESFYEPPSMQKKDSSHWALMFVILGIVTFLAELAQNSCFQAASSRLIERISSLSFEKIIHQDICWFDDPTNSSGAVGARISANASTLQSLVNDGLALLVQNMSTLVAGILVAFIENWILALVVVTLFSMTAMQILLETKLLQRFTTDAEQMYIEKSQVASDAIGSIRTVVSICAEDKMVELYQKKSGTKRIKWIHIGGSINSGFSQFAFYFTSALCFYLGAILVQHNRSSVPAVFKVFLALVATASGIAEASKMALDTKKATDLAISVCKILESKRTDESGSGMDMTLKSIVGDIEFKNVWFTYPSRPDVQVLKGVSLSISAGQTVVFVGESGNGKSTLINLVERFYDVDSGCILLDAIEIQKYKVKWLRQQMGLVSQEPVLFNKTIRSNIAYGKQEVTTEDEIVAAAKLANAHSFISALPQGYDTPVGKNGVQLSGGQKQRIAIARAIVKNPKILLLDEATSALDAESEKAVQDALDQVMTSKTTLVVTHRVSMIRANDTIAVLRNGMIVEKGTHDDLLKITEGAYASLFAYHLNNST